MDKDFDSLLEVVLKRNDREKKVEKILCVEKEAVVSKGENYGSQMTRVKMRVLLGSGKETIRTLIVKELPPTELRAKNLNDWGFFKIEIKMFREILPCMGRIMEETVWGREPLWGQCLEFRENDRLVLEDLKELGYRMADRRTGLDFAHAKLAMKSLGRFHACSVAMKERGLLNPSEFLNSVIINVDEIVDHFHFQSLTIVADLIDTTWEPEWKPYVMKIRNFIGKTASVLRELMNQDNFKFKVLNHGDCWVNNMLFKYASYDDLPVFLRFVDFQICYYNTYGYDLVYFMTTSVEVGVLEAHTEQLLAAYQESLEESLRDLKLESLECPSLEDVQAEVKNLGFLAFVQAVSSLAFMTTAPEDTVELEEVLKEFQKSKQAQFNLTAYKSKAYTTKLKYILKTCDEWGVFG